MCEADLSSADQVVIFKGDCACLQAINLTAFTTGDLVFMGGKKFLPVGVSSQQNVVRWNSLIYICTVEAMSPFMHFGFQWRILSYAIFESFWVLF